jgi:integrase
MATASKSRGARGEGRTVHLQTGPYSGQWRRIINVEDPTGRRRTKSFTKPTKSAAVKAAREWQEANGQRVPSRSAKSQTVADVVTLYLQDFEARRRRGDITANNLAWYQGAARIIQTDAIGKMEAAKVTSDHVNQMVERLLKGWGRQPKLGREYVRRLRSVLNQVMVVAGREGVVTLNPVAGSRPVKVRRTHVEGVRADEAQRFLEAAHQDRLHAFFAVLFGLALRRGEACGLKWSDYDLKSGVLKVRRQVKREPVDGRVVAVVGDLKTPESVRDLQVPEFVIDALAEHRTHQNAERGEAGDNWIDEDWIFTSPTRPGQHLDPSHAYRRTKAIARSVGINDLTIHKVRHTSLSALATAGVHPSTMQAIAGHSDPMTTLAIYTHVADASKQAAAKAMDEAFRARRS